MYSSKKRAVFVEEHLARLTVPQKIVSRGGSGVRTLPPYLFVLPRVHE
jgi:hypothetical protein